MVGKTVKNSNLMSYERIYKIISIIQISLFIVYSPYLFQLQDYSQPDNDLVDVDGRPPKPKPPKPIEIPFHFQINSIEFYDNFNYLQTAFNVDNASVASVEGAKSSPRASHIDSTATASADTGNAVAALRYLGDENRFTDFYYQFYSKLSSINHELIDFLSSSSWSNENDDFDLVLSSACSTRPTTSSTNSKNGTVTVLSLEKFYYASDDYIYAQYSSSTSKYPIIYSFPTNGNGNTLQDCSFCALQSPQSLGSLVFDFNKVLVLLGVTRFALGIIEFAGIDFIAFSLDSSGNEKFDLWVWDIKKQDIVAGPFHDTYYSARWACRRNIEVSNCWIYYNVVSIEWQVPLSIASAGPFTSSSSAIPGSIQQQVVYTESDPSLTVELDQSNDKLFLFIKIVGLETSEYKQITLPINNTISTPATVIKRVSGTLYDLTHRDGLFYIKTNANGASNFEVLSFPVNTTTTTASDSATSVLVARSDTDFIERIELFSQVLVYWFRRDGMVYIQGIDLQAATLSSSTNTTTFPIFKPPRGKDSAGYTLAQDSSLDFEARIYRPYMQPCFTFSNSSFLHPVATYAFDLSSRQPAHLVLKLERKHAFLLPLREETMWTHIHDSSALDLGISLLAPPTPRGVMVIGYGAYGGFQDPRYDAAYLVLAHQYGIAVAVCHPRGDGDMGAWWYRAGKYAAKVSTFNDVQRCIEYLVESGVAPADRVAVKGRSAGGLVAGNFFTGAIPKIREARIRPRVVIGHVPFIDPIYDLMEKRVPWTAYEWFEWGSPFDQEILETMMQYSPYLQLQTRNESAMDPVPALYLSSGVLDSRVPFWEPLKFAALARTTLDATQNGRIVIRVEDGGHFEASGVYATAEWMAFMIFHLGL